MPPLGGLQGCGGNNGEEKLQARSRQSSGNAGSRRLSGKACQCGGEASITGQGRPPHAVKQLSLCVGHNDGACALEPGAAATEPAGHRTVALTP